MKRIPTLTALLLAPLAKRTAHLLAIVFVSVLISPCGMAAGSYLLENANIKVRIAKESGLVSIENRLAAESYSFDPNVFVVATDLGGFSNREVSPASARADARVTAARARTRSTWTGSNTETWNHQSGLIYEDPTTPPDAAILRLRPSPRR